MARSQRHLAPGTEHSQYFLRLMATPAIRDCNNCKHSSQGEGPKTHAGTKRPMFHDHKMAL